MELSIVETVGTNLLTDQEKDGTETFYVLSKQRM